MEKVKWCPDWHLPKNRKANLLVTFGSRAGYMDAAGHIELHDGSIGEDKLAALGIALVDNWIETDPDDISFDEYIETALEQHFGKEKIE